LFQGKKKQACTTIQGTTGPMFPKGRINKQRGEKRITGENNKKRGTPILYVAEISKGGVQNKTRQMLSGVPERNREKKKEEGRLSPTSKERGGEVGCEKNKEWGQAGPAAWKKGRTGRPFPQIEKKRSFWGPAGTLLKQKKGVKKLGY